MIGHRLQRVGHQGRIDADGPAALAQPERVAGDEPAQVRHVLKVDAIVEPVAAAREPRRRMPARILQPRRRCPNHGRHDAPVAPAMGTEHAAQQPPRGVRIRQRPQHQHGVPTRILDGQLRGRRAAVRGAAAHQRAALQQDAQREPRPLRVPDAVMHPHRGQRGAVRQRQRARLRLHPPLADAANVPQQLRPMPAEAGGRRRGRPRRRLSPRRRLAEHVQIRYETASPAAGAGEGASGSNVT